MTGRVALNLEALVRLAEHLRFEPSEVSPNPGFWNQARQSPRWQSRRLSAKPRTRHSRICL
uniref:Uncharacterized protein n=1 Tax=Pseudomonas phage PACT201 TaxID=3230130 RepID=A0AAU8GSY8_9VIRU